MNANNDEGKLISGKEAYRLIGEGVDILASVYQPDGSMQWEDAKHLPACDILNDGFKFRLASPAQKETICCECNDPFIFKRGSTTEDTCERCVLEYVTSHCDY